jgi:hypothetical protein
MSLQSAEALSVNLQRMLDKIANSVIPRIHCRSNAY